MPINAFELDRDSEQASARRIWTRPSAGSLDGSGQSLSETLADCNQLLVELLLDLAHGVCVD